MAYFNRLFGARQGDEQLQQNSQPAQLFKSNNSHGFAGLAEGGGSPGNTMATVQPAMTPTRSGMRFVNSQRYFEQNPNQQIAPKITQRADQMASSELAANAAQNAGIQNYATGFSHTQDFDQNKIKNAVGNLWYNKDSPEYKSAYDYLSGLLNINFKDPGEAGWQNTDDFTKMKDLYSTGVSGDAGKNQLLKSFSTDPSRYTGGEMALDRLFYGSDTGANDALKAAASKLSGASDQIKKQNDATNAMLAAKRGEEKNKADEARRIMTKIYDENKDIIGAQNQVWNVNPGGQPGLAHGSPFEGVYTDQYTNNGLLRNTALDQYRSLAKILGIDPASIQVNKDLAAAQATQSVGQGSPSAADIQSDGGVDDEEWLKKHPNSLGHIARAQGK